MRYNQKTKPDIEIKIINQPHPWVLREQGVQRMIKDFLESYRHGVLWSSAVSGGWDFQLYRYVWEVAKIQAQIIAGSKVGYDIGVLFGYGSNVDKPEINSFLDEQRKLCADGSVDVRIPGHRMDFFKKNLNPLPR